MNQEVYHVGAKFRFPLLAAFVLLGGEAHRHDLLATVGKLVPTRPEDKWATTAAFALTMLKNQGYAEKLGSGRWRITGGGLAHFHRRLEEIARRDYEEYKGE
jgi:hypothetical protein